MRRTIIISTLLATMLLGLPLLGVLLADKEITPYLEFPPRTAYVRHAPFSWPMFIAYALFILAWLAPFLIRLARADRRPPAATPPNILPFPWWGWGGILFTSIAWILAWTRLPWISDFQAHTFTPLWLGYIITINALTYRRSGRCMLRNRPSSFLLLFPVSAGFWWFFEYLNRFVQNWYYVGPVLGSWEYFWYATLSFSTVLPAVLGTREWILGSSRLERGFKEFFPLGFSRPKAAAWAVLLLSGAGLAGIGVQPDYLFPLLWVSPLLIIVSLQTLMGERHALWDISRGDWRLAVSSALAALLCGWFWEMWNYYSLAKWEYAIPFVHKYQMFEMPALGYAGYLPFGLECTVIGGMLERAVRT